MAILAYILIVTTYGREKEVGSKLLQLKEAENLHELYGQYDIIFSVKVEKMEELSDLVDNKIRTIEGIERTETLVVSDIIKE